MTASSAHAAAALRRELFLRHPEDGARALEDGGAREAAQVLAAEPADVAAGVLTSLVPETAAEVLERLPDEAFSAAVGAADAARVAPVIARFPLETRDGRLRLLDRRVADELARLMSYPADSAGGLMDPRATAFRPGTTVAQALDHLREARTRDTEDLFVVGDDGRLLGAVALQDLALAPAGAPLGAVARGTPNAVPATATVADVLETFRGRSGGVAVVDFEGRLLGVIRQPRLLAAAREDLSADLQTMVGASREERALSPALFAVRRRLPWLNVNLGTAFLAAAVVGLFEGTIERITALAVLMPVVAGQSGNSGAQALAVTMRGLALREVRPAHWRRLAAKEVTVGLLNGLAIALVTSLSVFVWSRSAGLAAVIGSAMVISMTLAGLAGASVPVVLEALGQDPAQSSSIVLTTVTDVAGFLSFLGLAALFARYLAPG